MVKELALGKTFNRKHTATGIHRRIPDPPEPPDKCPTVKLKNLKPHKEKPR